MYNYHVALFHFSLPVIRISFRFSTAQDDEADYYDSRRSHRRYEEDLEEEVRAEKRIMNAKKVFYLELCLIMFTPI